MPPSKCCAMAPASTSARSGRTTGPPSSPPSTIPARGRSTEIAFFLNVDLISHVALVAVVRHDDGGEEIAGGGRYIVLQPGRAEAAFTVVDQFQGQGLGTALLRHLAAIAGDAGIHEFVAEVLPDNTAMLEVFEHSGLPMASKREPAGGHVTVPLT